MALSEAEKALMMKHMDYGTGKVDKERLKNDPDFIALAKVRKSGGQVEKPAPPSTETLDHDELWEETKNEEPTVKPKPKSTYKPKPSGVDKPATLGSIETPSAMGDIRKSFGESSMGVVSEGRRKLAEAGIGTGYTSGGNMQNTISNAMNQTHSIIGGAGKGRLGKLEDRLARRQEGVEGRVGGRILKRQAKSKRQGTRAAAKELKNLSMAVPAQKLNTIQKDSGPTTGPSQVVPEQTAPLHKKITGETVDRSSAITNAKTLNQQKRTEKGFGTEVKGATNAMGSTDWKGASYHGASINTGPSRKGGNIPTSTKPRSTVSGVPTKEAALLSSTLSGGGMSLPGGKSKPSTLPHKEAALVSSVISGGGASLPGGRSSSTKSTQAFPSSPVATSPDKNKKRKRKLDRTKGLTEQATSKYKNEVKVKGLTEQPSLRGSSGNSPFSYSKKDNYKRSKKYKK